MKPQILFISHGNCFDGHTAKWVFEKFRQKTASLFDRPVEYFDGFYGDDPPDTTGKEVWVVDFSYKRPVMMEMIRKSAKTIILDHHKSAEADLDGILDEVRTKYKVQRDQDKVIFDMNRSGAGILYDELEMSLAQKAGAHRPQTNGRSMWLVDYVEDRDLWRHKLPDSGLVTAYMSSLPMTFTMWDAMEALGRARVVEQGRAIQRYIDVYGEKSLKQARHEWIAGHKVPTVNMPYMNVSEHLDRLKDEYPDAPFVASYFRKRDGKWAFSLRSKPDGFDVSKIAETFGGGGHRGAAGFVVDVLPWEQEKPVPANSGDPEDAEVNILHMGEDTE